MAAARKAGGGVAGGRARPRTVGTGQLSLMTLGGIVGSGLFLASGQAIRYAGPGVVLAYLIGGLAMALEIAAFAEMAAAEPLRGSFITYSRRAIGPWAAFVGGWLFWFSSVLNLGAEATAGAVFTRLWLPGLPVWTIALAYALGVVAVNLLPVRGFGGAEAAMAAVKVGAVGLFVLAAAAWLLPHPGRVLWLSQPLFPHGARGVAQAMVLVTFSLAGTGVLGLAAAEARRPERTVAAAMRRCVATVAVLYPSSLLAITALVPTAAVPTRTRSPFVAALARFAPPWAATAFNLMVLLAVLSAMAAGLFATNRVLVALARDGDAPAGLGRLNRHGTPLRANLVTGVCLAAAASLAYVLPRQAFLYLVTATGFQALLIWLLIVVTHIRYRRHLLRAWDGADLPLRVPLFPLASWGEVGLLLAIMATAAVTPDERLPLAAALAVAALAGAAFAVLRPDRRRA
jgi:L-asparagine transporter-like permease